MEVRAFQAVDELLRRGLHPAAAVQRHNQPQVGLLLRESHPGVAGSAVQPTQVAQSEHASAGDRRKRSPCGERHGGCRVMQPARRRRRASCLTRPFYFFLSLECIMCSHADC